MCCCSCCTICCRKACSKVLFSAIFTSVECVLFGSLNFFYLFGYYCVIEPPQKDQLSYGARFFEDVWSWFIYSEKTCVQKQGGYYEPPIWLEPVPLYFIENDLWSAVAAYTTVFYQLSYLILHALWFISCMVLLYGNAVKKHFYYYPYLIIGILIFIFDLIIGSIYCSFLAQVNPTGSDWKAPFSMIVYYFRFFFFFLINLFMLIYVFNVFKKIQRRRRSERKLMRNITLQVDTTIVQALAPLQGNVLQQPPTPAVPSTSNFNGVSDPSSTTTHQNPLENSGKINEAFDVAPNETPARDPTAPPLYSPPPYVSPVTAYNPYMNKELEDRKQYYSKMVSSNPQPVNPQPFSYTTPPVTKENNEEINLTYVESRFK